MKDDENLQIFVDESLEHLDDFEQNLLRIEQAGPEFDPEVVNKVFRAVHTVKGGAGLLGLNNLNRLAHRMENLLGLIRDHTLVPNAEITSFLLQAGDVLKSMINNVQDSELIDVSDHLQALDALIENVATEEICADTESSEPSVRSLQDPDQKQESVPGEEHFVSLSQETYDQSTTQGKALYILKILLDEAHSIDPDQEEHKLTSQLAPYGDVLHTQKKIDDDFSCIYFTFASVLAPSDMELLPGAQNLTVWVVQSDLSFLPVRGHDLEPSLSSASAQAIEQTQGVAQPHQEASGPEPDPQFSPSHKIQAQTEDINSIQTSPERPEEGQRSLRVKLTVLDTLMNLAGELVLGRNQLLQSVEAGDVRGLQRVSQRVDQITSEVQDAVMQARMQPIGRLFTRFPRIVRDLARNLHKEVNMQISGQDVEIDRSILEVLYDPLTHLIRNAADHGIETPEVRKGKGKSEAGSLSLRAYHETGKVIVEVADDGTGLDPEAIAAAAVDKKLISREQLSTLTRKDKIHLIFLPGFSLSKDISEISGRGVGMDVVKTNLDSIGGQIWLESRPDQGTLVRITLPLTLAVVPVFLLGLEGQTYAVPQMKVEELLRIPAWQVKHRLEVVGDMEVVRVRDSLVPVAHLAQILGVRSTCFDCRTQTWRTDRRSNIADRRSPRSPLHREDASPPQPDCASDQAQERRSTMDRRNATTSSLQIVIVSSGVLRYGLVVDTFLDMEEIVSKPLGTHLQSCQVFSGASVLGDGRVALILDVEQVAKKGQLISVDESSRAQEVAKEGQSAEGTKDTAYSLLLFQCAQGEHFALPMQEVLRIEKIARQDIHPLGRRLITHYQGVSLPVYSMDQVADVCPLAHTDDLLLLVCSVKGRSFGILGIGPLDSVHDVVDIDRTTFVQDGIFGSSIIHGQTTLLVDIQGMMDVLEPDWFVTQKQGQGLKRPSILVVEDSNFFRKQIKALLEDDQYHVLEAEDGGVAWDMLQDSEIHVDMVLTDLEMPHMDGFELARKIKENSLLSCIPIIALTTLAQDADMHKGLEAGFDAYHIKLDREELLQSIAQCFSSRHLVIGGCDVST
ncbi:MAG: chemotaxis protein CheW [Desulfovermiculus sp.]|nr:chemotaxis protein CheW [Desulfovermiculus sp.]